jgi:RNA polymerase sigma-70 factor (ECF subfamily)
MESSTQQRFERAMMPHLDAAYVLARFLVHDPHDAEDLVQDAYLRALRHFGSFRGGDGRGWLLTIVRRTCYTWLARRRSLPQITSYEEDEHGAHDGPGPDVLAVRQAQRDQLLQAVARLPVEYREAVVLRDLQGLSYQEIAEILDVPMGTVMSRLARGRMRLQAVLPVEDFLRS